MNIFNHKFPDLKFKKWKVHWPEFSLLLHFIVASGICLVAMSLTGRVFANELVFGEWVVGEEIDPINDQLIIKAVVKNETSAFGLYCTKDRTTSIVWFPNFSNLAEVELIIGDVQVKSRIDSQIAETTNWFSTSFSVHKNDQDAINFLNHAYSAKKLALRVYGKFNIEVYTSVFEISGINRVVDKVSDACGWQVNK